MKKTIVLAVVLAACAAPVIEPGAAESPVSSSETTSVESETTTTTVAEATTTTTSTTTSTTTTAPSSEDDVISKPPPERVPSEPPAEGTGGEVPAAYLDAVIADAAERVGVSVDDVTVLEATAVVWSDGSLGCPQPGQGYVQVLIDGYRVIVSAGGQTLDYRLDSRGSFFVCEGLGRAPQAPPDA